MEYLEDETVEESPAEEEVDYEAIVTFLRDEERMAWDSEVDEERAAALDFYNGEPFGDEEEGRSQIVTRDVAEVIDYMTVSLLRTMVSGDKVVEFECAEPPRKQQQDEQGQPIPLPPTVAECATAAVTQEFFQGQDGYRFLHDWIKAGLLEKTSVAKVCVEKQDDKRIEREVSEDELLALQATGANIVAAEQTENGFRVAILEPQPPKFRDYVSPNEETRVSVDARDLDSDCPYDGFATARSLSELSKMGFWVDDITDDQGLNNDQLSQARDSDNRDRVNMGFNRTGVNRKVWHFEEYFYYDIDGDGVAELLMAHRVGNELLKWADTMDYAIERVDEQPGVMWCPFPMPHRLIGQSLADKVMDIQRTRSVLMRQGLDNLYQSNSPRMMLHEDSTGVTTIDDLLTVRAGGIVRWKGVHRPEPVTLPFVAQSAFEVMDILAGEKEQRTGITRLNQGLDADTLNKTASGQAMLQATGQQIEEYLARNFAEAFARLMLKKYRLMKKYGKPMDVSIDGQSVKVDPSTWPDDMNVQVRVGLGSGRKDQRLQYRTMLLEIAQAAVQNGSRVFTDDNIYNNVAGIIADANLGDVKQLATDPATLGEAPEKPDPAMAKAQADAMLNAEKLKGEQTKNQADAMMAAQQMQMEAEFRDREIALKEADAALDHELKRDKATFEANLAKQSADREWELALMGLAQQREIADRQHEATEMANKRPGGDLDK